MFDYLVDNPKSTLTKFVIIWKIICCCSNFAKIILYGFHSNLIRHYTIGTRSIIYICVCTRNKIQIKFRTWKVNHTEHRYNRERERESWRDLLSGFPFVFKFLLFIAQMPTETASMRHTIAIEVTAMIILRFMSLFFPTKSREINTCQFLLSDIYATSKIKHNVMLKLKYLCCKKF